MVGLPEREGADDPPPRPAAALVVRVVTPEGRPVPQFNARLVSKRGARDLGESVGGGITIEARGELAADLTEGFIEVWGARDESGRDIDPPSGRAGPLKGDERVLEVRLAGVPMVKGRVSGPDGSPVAGLEVEVEIDRDIEWMLDLDLDDLRDQPRSKGRTDSSGRFALALPGSGSHRLMLDVPESHLRVRSLVVRPGDPPLEIRLRHGSEARVLVLDPDGRPQAEVRVHAQELRSEGDGAPPDTWSWGDENTDAGGIAVLRRLDARRRYRLLVDPNYRTWLRGVGGGNRKGQVADTGQTLAAPRVIEDWAPADTTVHLERGFNVNGVVTDTEGEPVSGRYVGIRTLLGFSCSKTDEEGIFRFEGVPSGPACLGLDDGGTMGCIVDRLRFTLPAVPPSARKHVIAPSPDWTDIDVRADITGVNLLVPRTLTVTMKLKEVESGQGERESYLSTSSFAQLHILSWNENGWVWERTADDSLTDMDRLMAGEPIQVRRLRPGGRYAAWMPPHDGRYAYVEFGAEAGEVTLERRTGGAVKGQVLGRPADASHVQLYLRDNLGRMVSWNTVGTDGRFEMHGLPESTWTASATCRTATGEVLRAQGAVSTGSSLDLELSPAPKPSRFSDDDYESVPDISLGR